MVTQGLHTLQGVGSVLLGEVGKELREIIRDGEGWTGQGCQGSAWRPELRTTF